MTRGDTDSGEMALDPSEIEDLPPYTVRAHNTSAESDNKIHDDVVAAQYGFQGGLVPGVAIYAYITVPVIERFGAEWLEQGLMHVRFQKPVYEGDRVTVLPGITSGSPSMILIAERDDGVNAATAYAALLQESLRSTPATLASYPDLPLPAADSRLPASREFLKPGTGLGTLKKRLDLKRDQPPLLEKIGEKLPIYYGAEAVAHPYILLALANQFLMQNVKLGPWIHTQSDLMNWSIARDGDEIAVRGRIEECFEAKGHEFVVLDLILACGDRIVQEVQHTAIYRIRPAGSGNRAT
jgi:acyl dehydratase